MRGEWYTECEESLQIATSEQRWVRSIKNQPQGMGGTPYKYEWSLQIKQLGVTLAVTPSGFTYVHAQCSFANVGLAQGSSIIEEQNT